MVTTVAMRKHGVQDLLGEIDVPVSYTHLDVYKRQGEGDVDEFSHGGAVDRHAMLAVGLQALAKGADGGLSLIHI